MQRYCIARMEEKIVSFLLDEKGHALEIHADEESSRLVLGDVYIGRVQNVAKNIQAAFVEIRPGLICYLPLSDLKNPIYTRKGPSPGIQQGDELVVQISREAIKTKAPSLTTNLCFQGKYVIVDTGNTELGISRKLSSAERERLRGLLDAYTRTECTENVHDENSDHDRKKRDNRGTGENSKWEFGIVLRTNAANVPEQMIYRELDELIGLLRRIQEIAGYRTLYSSLYQTPPQWLKRIAGLNCSETEQIVIEDPELYRQAAEYLKKNLVLENGTSLLRLVHYQDPMLPMVKLYSLERELREALEERVWMNSGAYLVIQPTEALTVVDVNTGKCETGRNKEEAILKVNLEAARETARQLRLRNLSGIIIVDFINMKEEASKHRVMEELKRSLALDPIQARAIDMTKLNLVEITRKKVEKPLAEHMRTKCSG